MNAPTTDTSEGFPRESIDFLVKESFDIGFLLASAAYLEFVNMVITTMVGTCLLYIYIQSSHTQGLILAIGNHAAIHTC